VRIKKQAVETPIEVDAGNDGNQHGRHHGDRREQDGDLYVQAVPRRYPRPAAPG